MPVEPGDQSGRSLRDTIVALSTAPGRGAIAIVRLSGPGAKGIAEKIFRPKSGEEPFKDRKFVYGRFTGPGGEAFDEGMAVFMAGPGSYTGEDVCEMFCHGGPAIVRALIEAACDAGARPAGPGEFTRRAFLEGKIDLLQCESVADLVSAETGRAARAALSHLSGALSGEIESIWEEIVEVGAHIEAAIDFPDEFEPGAGPAPSPAPMGEQELAIRFSEIAGKLRALEETYRSGRILREGARVAILGRPNAGKSTLLNRLLGTDRAIMSPHPGTTRDTVEEVCDIGGIPVRLIDTAGLRETGDPIEIEGAERARRAAEEADLCLVMMDAAAGREEAEWARAEVGIPGYSAILVANKMDLPGARLPGDDALAARACAISALSGEGVDALREAIAASLAGDGEGFSAGDQRLLTRERHRDLVAKCRKAIERGRDALDESASPELVAVDLNEGQRALSELLGRDYGPALLDKIFSTFCIGK
ncbi:MAG: tRNA uridine-5-carboxymethylaminomethyl(34) synthesis GTPase MnmE [bacterium]